MAVHNHRVCFIELESKFVATAESSEKILFA
jgi:hypothetical protein